MGSRRSFLVGGLGVTAGALAGCAFDVRAATRQRTIPTILVCAQSTAHLSCALPEFVRFLQAYVDDYIAPVWGARARIVMAKKPDPKFWNIVILDEFDDSDPSGALAYHDFDPSAAPLPWARVQTENQAIPTSVVVTHELGEMLVNPGVNNWAGMGPDDAGLEYNAWGGLLCLEIADPVEMSFFTLHGLPASNFVHPNYFQDFDDGGPYDQVGVLERPRQVVRGGYQILRADSKVFEYVYPLHGNPRIVGADRAEGRRCNRWHKIVRGFRPCPASYSVGPRR